jgi:asparagine synthase (glutamine-hydrolysing)
MCGIAGVLGPDSARPGLVERMSRALRTRGPDDEGVFRDPAGLVALGHRRLSILDPSSAGRQPMESSSGRTVIAYNGEIYNFRELRGTLESKGIRFRTRTDTEVILALYEEEGVDCLRRLRGMFAFALWDASKRRLLLARDRLGIKPLYVTRVGASLLFASEVKSLLLHPGVRRTLDPEALEQFLTFLWVPDPRTPFRGIEKVPPGHYLLVEDGHEALRAWWDAPLEVGEPFPSVDAATDAVRETLGRVVREHMVSDVPLGAFLSGGIDSTAILHFMAEASPRPVTTYTAGFSAEDLRHEIVPDDVRWARLAAKRYGADASEIPLEPRVAELLPLVARHLDDPVADPAAITTYLICRAARERLVVMLSGMGGDEIFAGYPRHLAMRLAGVYDRLPGPARRFVERRARAWVPAAGAGRFTAPRRNLRKFLRSASRPYRERYLGYSSYYDRGEARALLVPDVAGALGDHDPFEVHLRCFERARALDPVDQLLYVDLKTFLPCLNLAYTDRMSMAASVEVRVPFLDHELVELAARIPSRWKLRGLTRKWIFKRAMRGFLPDPIVDRPKAGFGAPIRAWLVGELRGMVADLLGPAAIRRRGLFDPAAIATLVRENESGREDHSLRIWTLLTLELWQREHLDRAPAEAATLEASGARTSPR